MKKKVGVIAALSVLLVALSAVVAQAAIVRTIDPTAGPNGTHFAGRTDATCTVSGTTVNCSSYQLAGVGNINATATLNATYTATVVCVNGGQNPSDSQHQGTFPATTGPVPLHSDKNGRLSVPSLSVSAPSEQEFLAQQSCPNPNWTPTVPGGISLASFTYTLQFEGFTGNYITITGP
jgi:hypothetical protein